MQFIGSENRLRAALLIMGTFVLAASAGAAMPPGVTFQSDFAVDRERGKWGHAQVMEQDRLYGRGERTHHGKPAAFVDVRPGDNPLSCCHRTERAEVLHMRADAGPSLQETSRSRAQYFGVSYRFPIGFNTFAHTVAHPWQIVLQLHGPDVLQAAPALALDVKYGRFVVRTNGGDLARGSRSVQRELLDSSLNLGNWTDLMMRVEFASDDSGSVIVWRRNEAETHFREVLHLDGISTLQYDSVRDIRVGGHYWKQGLYRSAMPVRNTFWMGPIARGTSFAAVERGAFRTKSGMPAQDFSEPAPSVLMFSQVSPIPEPESYVLWLSGLGLLVAVVRVRRRNGVQHE